MDKIELEFFTKYCIEHGIKSEELVGEKLAHIIQEIRNNDDYKKKLKEFKQNQEKPKPMDDYIIGYHDSNDRQRSVGEHEGELVLGSGIDQNPHGRFNKKPGIESSSNISQLKDQLTPNELILLNKIVEKIKKDANFNYSLNLNSFRKKIVSRVITYLEGVVYSQKTDPRYKKDGKYEDETMGKILEFTKPEPNSTGPKR